MEPGKTSDKEVIERNCTKNFLAGASNFNVLLYFSIEISNQMSGVTS